jgi:hypothetical protein
MTKYLDKKFSSPANNQAFRNNWDAVFGEPQPKDPLAFACGVCGKQIRKGWFAPFFGGEVKCGACCNPPREDWTP